MLPITLRNVTKRYGETTAVDSVDLDIEQGELFFLLGPSGCGKTTLLRMLAGLIELTGGSIKFGERDVTHLPTGKRNTAMVFQGYALWPHMTVRQNVAFGLDVRKVAAGEKQQRVEEALRITRLNEYHGRRPTQLSGGQQQRVALARSLVVNPDVLLLDEPLSNLDAKLRLEMRREIRRICDETNVTAVYVTHDQEEALSMADRIAVMDRGRLMQVGPPREVYERPRSRFVADFLGAANFIPAVVKGRENGSITLDTDAGEIRSDVFSDDVPAGGNVTCSIRPEAVGLLDAGEEADNILAGKLVDSVYLGNVAQHVFELPSGLQIKVDELKPRPRDEAASLNVGFAASDVVVLTD